MLKENAINLLNQTIKCPKMYATDKEAFLMRVSTILEIVDENFSVENFYKTHLKTFGSNYIGLNEEIDDIWAKEVINDALYLLKS